MTRTRLAAVPGAQATAGPHRRERAIVGRPLEDLAQLRSDSQLHGGVIGLCRLRANESGVFLAPAEALLARVMCWRTPGCNLQQCAICAITSRSSSPRRTASCCSGLRTPRTEQPLAPPAPLLLPEADAGLSGSPPSRVGALVGPPGSQAGSLGCRGGEGTALAAGGGISGLQSASVPSCAPATRRRRRRRPLLQQTWRSRPRPSFRLAAAWAWAGRLGHRPRWPACARRPGLPAFRN